LVFLNVIAIYDVVIIVNADYVLLLFVFLYVNHDVIVIDDVVVISVNAYCHELTILGDAFSLSLQLRLLHCESVNHKGLYHDV